MSNNRLWNCGNSFQGDDIKVLCVCSAGLLRSPTLARWLSRNFKNVNPRAVGTSEDHALIPLDHVHLTWADAILCADAMNFSFVQSKLTEFNMDREVHCLNLPDDFSFGDPILEDRISIKIDLLMSILRGMQTEEDVQETCLLQLEKLTKEK